MLYRFDNVTKSYGVHDILRGVTWQHNPGERVGLVGRNGAGKTTFFRLLLNREEPDHGTIIRASGLTIGHVGQHLDATPGQSMFDYVLGAFGQVLAIENRMREIEHELADAPSSGDAHDRLLEKYANLQHDYEHANGYTLHSEVERVLTGVGFTVSEWNRPVLEFSGGQQNRAMLARVLLTKVDLLLLDEPTNHLDLAGIEFLEEFLESFRGSYLIVSHDRTFLNRTVTQIVELANGRIVEYHGNYDRFIAQRAERHQQLTVEYDRQQETIERTRDFIRRNLVGQKTKQAQSRRNMLERMEVLDRPETDETLAKFTLDAGPRSGAVAMRAERLDVGYEKGKVVVHDFSILIRRGERYAIMGPNGSGKSTLLKAFAGRLEPLAGELEWGHNVQTAYYDQTLGDLSPSKRVLDEIWDLDHSQPEETCRSYLARYSFFGEDVEKKVSALSGGEKGRLALAKIMHAGGNLLLLDEPTNHLDVYTREALEEALAEFTGALVVISHDRYFIDRIAESIILVEDGEAVVHPGNYTELVDRFKKEAARLAAVKAPPANSAQKVPANAPRREDRKSDKSQKKLEAEVAALESKIAELETLKAANDQQLCQEVVWRDAERSKALKTSNEGLTREIAMLTGKWEELSAKMAGVS